MDNSWRAVVKVLRSPVRVVRTLADDLVTTVFPADCRCCDGPLERAAAVPVCETCVGRVKPSNMAGCGRCGEAMDLDLDLEDARFAGMLAEGFVCRECRLAEPEFARAVAYGSYAGELRELIRLLKFDHVPGVARLLGRQMAEAVLMLEGQAASGLLVIAVPLFRERERQRGYNQSVLLADEALDWLKKARPDWKLVASHRTLERHRHTESSYVLSRKGRRRNLSGAFRVTEDIARTRGVADRRSVHQRRDGARMRAGARASRGREGLGGGAGKASAEACRAAARGSGRVCGGVGSGGVRGRANTEIPAAPE